MTVISRGFAARLRLDPEPAKRLPPGQRIVGDFPVLTVGAPRITCDE